jgi:membrane associated rhomboid family serine protease
MELQGRDALLFRVLPFGGVVAFLAASTVLAFASPAAGAAGLFTTMGGVLYAYLTRRAPPPTQPPPTLPSTPP